MQVEAKIKNYMEDNKISQVFICHHTNIKPSKLSLTLNGKRRMTFDEYEKVCGALNVPVDRFLEAKPPQLIPPEK